MILVQTSCLLGTELNIKTEYCLPLGSGYLNRQSATFFIFRNYQHRHRKNEVSEMIESMNDASRNLEKALQASWNRQNSV